MYHLIWHIIHHTNRTHRILRRIPPLHERHRPNRFQQSIIGATVALHQIHRPNRIRQTAPNDRYRHTAQEDRQHEWNIGTDEHCFGQVVDRVMRTDERGRSRPRTIEPDVTHHEPDHTEKGYIAIVSHTKLGGRAMVESDPSEQDEH